jgi:hypothetical protein
VSDTVTALDLVTRAFQTLGVYSAEDSLPGGPAQLAFRRLNSMIGAWALEALTIPTVSRTIWPLVAAKGSETNPYLIGPTAGVGNFVTPTRPLEIEACGILLSGATPQVELSRTVFNDQMWQAIAVKDLTSPIFTGVFYTPSVPNGEIVLWPIPDTAIHSLVLYRGEQLAQFATLTTSVVLPDGYADALDFNLAVRLAPSQGIAVTPDLVQLSRSSLATLKRANTQMTDLENDFARQGGDRYNIVTGNY